MVASLVVFALFIMIYILISDIITILFRLTGMTEEKARFQVISLLTNSGFTTRESEAVVASQLRRRLARATMLFGYAFTVTIVSTTVNFIMSLGESELKSVIIVLPLLVCVLLIFHLIHRSARFRTRFDGWIERIGNHLMFEQNANQAVLVEDYGGVVVAHIYLHRVPDKLKGKRLEEADIAGQHNLMVMMVRNKGGEARQADADTVLQQEDVIVVLGRRKAIKEVFETV